LILPCYPTGAQPNATATTACIFCSMGHRAAPESGTNSFARRKRRINGQILQIALGCVSAHSTPSAARHVIMCPWNAERRAVMLSLLFDAVVAAPCGGACPVALRPSPPGAVPKALARVSPPAHRVARSFAVSCRLVPSPSASRPRTSVSAIRPAGCRPVPPPDVPARPVPVAPAPVAAPVRSAACPPSPPCA